MSRIVVAILLALCCSCTPANRAELVSKALETLAREACKPALDRCKAKQVNPCEELLSCQRKRRAAFGLLKEIVR